MQYIILAISLLILTAGIFLIVIGSNKLKKANRVEEEARVILNEPVKIIQERRAVEELKAHYSIPSYRASNDTLDTDLMKYFIKDLTPELMKYVRVRSEDNPAQLTKEIEISLLVVGANADYDYRR